MLLTASKWICPAGSGVFGFEISTETDLSHQHTCVSSSVGVRREEGWLKLWQTPTLTDGHRKRLIAAETEKTIREVGELGRSMDGEVMRSVRFKVEEEPS